MGRYRVALAGWVRGGVAAPLALTIAVVVWVAAVCGDRTDCSWGFELLLVVPVLLYCFLVSGPRLVGRRIAEEIDPGLRRRAARTARGAALLGLIVLYAGGGGWRALLAYGVVSLGVPGAVAWRTRPALEA